VAKGRPKSGQEKARVSPFVNSLVMSLVGLFFTLLGLCLGQECHIDDVVCQQNDLPSITTYSQATCLSSSSSFEAKLPRGKATF